MAYSEEQWERTKALFESGQYSLSEISDKTGINKSQISRKSKTQQWQNGRNADYIEAREIIATKKATETQQTLQILDDVADEAIWHKRLINDNATKLADKLSTMADQIDNPTDLKTLVDANDRLAITLKVADRHAPKIDVTQMQAVQASGTTKIEIIEDIKVSNG